MYVCGLVITKNARAAKMLGKQMLRREIKKEYVAICWGQFAADNGVVDQPIALTTKEFALLELFMRNAGRVLSRDEILAHAWDEEYDSFSNIIDVYVNRLRKKVDLEGRPSLFNTVRGVGYGIRA